VRVSVHSGANTSDQNADKQSREIDRSSVKRDRTDESVVANDREDSGFNSSDIFLSDLTSTILA
jgi:hypothetical protein